MQAGSVAGETEDAPEELLQSEPADPAEHWLGEIEDAPRELPLTAQEPGGEAGRPGAEAGHSETWASRPADLPRHWLGETEDAPEELLQSEPADPAEHWLREQSRASRAGVRRTRHQLPPGKARAEMRAVFRPRVATERGFEVLPTGGVAGPWVGIQVD